MKEQHMFMVTSNEAQRREDNAWMWGFMYGMAGACVLAGVVFMFSGRIFGY